MRNGGLLTVPPQTTMILPESNTTEYVFTTATTASPTGADRAPMIFKSDDNDSLATTHNSMGIVSTSFTVMDRQTTVNYPIRFYGHILLQNHGEVTKLSLLFLLIIFH